MPTSNTLLNLLNPAIALLSATMLLLPIFLAAKAHAATTYTITILDDNPDQRTLSSPVLTSSGDVFSTITLYPDGVNSDGQTRYARQTGVSAGQTVTSFIEIPPSSTPTTTPSGTLTQTLPYHQGHHIEVLTVTDPDGTVHEITRIDQQSTHVTVSPTTKPNGETVLVSSGLYPPAPNVTTTTVLASPAPTPAPTQQKALEPVRELPICNNGKVTWTTVEPGCWPVYDMMVPTKPNIDPTPSKCAKVKKEDLTVFNVIVANIPMKGSNMAESHESHNRRKRDELKQDIKGIFRREQCILVRELVDFGTCGNLTVQALYRETTQLKKSKKHWLFRWWWIFPAIFLPLFLICLLPCCLCRRRHRRENAEKHLKNEQPVTVVQGAAPVVVGTAAGTGAGGATGGAAGQTAAGGPAATGAGGAGGAGGSGATGGGTTTTTTPAGTAPPATAAPTEVVTTTTEKETPGTLRRAAEEGRAGRNVRFDGKPAETVTTTPAHQVDGTAELRTGSEVFDVGSMRGRKRNRGDEPL